MTLVKEIYPVEGMSCASCALSIQTILAAQDLAVVTGQTDYFGPYHATHFGVNRASDSGANHATYFGANRATFLC